MYLSSSVSHFILPIFYFDRFPLFSVRGIYYVTPDHYSLSEKFMKVGCGFDC